MEQSVAVQLVKEVKSENAAVKTIIMDDTTTFSHLRKEYDASIEKWSDVNHATKTFRTMIYNISKICKVLTANKNNVIDYMRKCFSHVVAQCEKSSEILSNNLRHISLHAFGDHSGCGRWCGALSDPDYKFSSLPRGQPLQDNNLKEDLVNTFVIFALSADRIATGGSTKSNESFNNIVVSKAQKSRHYNGSESLASHTFQKY